VVSNESIVTPTSLSDASKLTLIIGLNQILLRATLNP